MSDIVERLESIPAMTICSPAEDYIDATALEAATEIRRLRDYIAANMKDAEIAERAARLGVDLHEAANEIQRLQARLAEADYLLDEASHVIIEHRCEEVAPRWMDKWEARFRQFSRSRPTDSASATAD